MDKDGWRPIETAKQTDDPIMLAWQAVIAEGARPRWFMAVGWWDGEFESAGWDEEKDDVAYRGAWTDGGVGSFAYEEYRELHPTHWRELPPPPSGPRP